MANRSIRILLVDDSAMMRKAVRSLLAPISHFEIVGEAVNGVEAIEQVADLEPDVVILDVNMPVMSGMTALKHIMISCPVPVIMLSAMTQSGSVSAFEALRFGAVDFIAKPSGLDDDRLAILTKKITRKVQAASVVQLGRLKYIKAAPQQVDVACVDMPPEKVVLVGGAEGSGAVLLKMIPQLSQALPLAVIAIIHEDYEHVVALARYLDGFSTMAVLPAKDGDKLQQGVCYLCAGDHYVTLAQGGGEQVLRVSPAPFHDSGQRGAVDMLMFSAVELFNEDIVAVIVSGADKDGMEGLQEVQNCGGTCIVQAPENCLHPTMAEIALVSCDVDFVVHDSELAQTVTGVAVNSI